MARTTHRFLWSALLIVVVAAFIAGCGGSDSGDGSSTSAATTGDSQRKLHFILVAHGPSTTPPFDQFVHGLEKADADLNVTTEFRGVQLANNDPNGERRLIESAIAKKPDGLIVIDPFPKSLNPAIKRATDAGIPVVLMNAGIGETEATGALSVFANDEFGAGKLGGEQMKKLGVKRPLIVTVPQGALPLGDDRNDGFVKGYGGHVERADIPLDKLADAVFMKNQVEAKLLKDPAIDGVFSIGSSISPSLRKLQGELGARGKQIKWGSIDVIPEVTTALKRDEWAFTLDQQLFAQAYLSVVALTMYERYGMVPGSKFVPTGPGLVTPDNIAKLDELQAKK